MKRIFIILVVFISFSSIYSKERTCRVMVCNKLERLSLSIWSHIKDHMGESCFEAMLPESEAIVNKVLSSESRWYQGSKINITKNSVTRVKKVYSCE